MSKFNFFDEVAHADPYFVAYEYHGTVVDFRGADVLVKWKERSHKMEGLQKEWYNESELRKLNDSEDDF